MELPLAYLHKQVGGNQLILDGSPFGRRMIENIIGNILQESVTTGSPISREAVLYCGALGDEPPKPSPEHTIPRNEPGSFWDIFKDSTRI